MNQTKQEQYNILLEFFYECVKYWERFLKVDSDLDKQPYINALEEIPDVDPNVPFGKPFDKDVLENFTKDRYMDTYGKEWEKYYTKIN